MRDPALWRRLLRVRFDAPGRIDLVGVVQRRKRWRRPRAHALVEEYRRFLYLTQVAADEVAPPLELDLLWGQHIQLHPAHYEWLCRQVLRGWPERSLLPAGRGELYAVRYPLTRIHYGREFGAQPPRQIWFDPSEPSEARLPWLSLLGIIVLANSCAMAIQTHRLEPLGYGGAVGIALWALPYLLPRRLRGKGLTLDQARRRMRRAWDRGEAAGDGGGDGGGWGGDGGGGE